MLSIVLVVDRLILLARTQLQERVLICWEVRYFRQWFPSLAILRDSLRFPWLIICRSRLLPRNGCSLFAQQLASSLDHPFASPLSSPLLVPLKILPLNCKQQQLHCLPTQ